MVHGLACCIQLWIHIGYNLWVEFSQHPKCIHNPNGAMHQTMNHFLFKIVIMSYNMSYNNTQNDEMKTCIISLIKNNFPLRNPKVWMFLVVAWNSCTPFLKWSKVWCTLEIGATTAGGHVRQWWKKFFFFLGTWFQDSKISA